jgi:hypothetical protein
VAREVGTAEWLARVDRPRILVLSPRPFRFELEIIGHGQPYRYSFIDDPRAPWTVLQVPGRTYLLLEGDPEPLRAALAGAYADGRMAGYAVFVPEADMPTRPFTFPAGTELLVDPSVPRETPRIPTSPPAP